MNIHELSAQLLSAKVELENALRDHAKLVRESAEADRAARLAKASAYLAAHGTVQERSAHVDQGTADLQYAAKLKDGLEKSALEAIRSKRQILSSIQSLAGALRAETEFAKWESRETA